MKLLAELFGRIFMFLGLALIKLAYHTHKTFKTKLGEEIITIEKKRQEVIDKFYENLVNISEDELDSKSKTKQQYDA